MSASAWRRSQALLPACRVSRTRSYPPTFIAHFDGRSFCTLRGLHVLSRTEFLHPTVSRQHSSSPAFIAILDGRNSCTLRQPSIAIHIPDSA